LSYDLLIWKLKNGSTPVDPAVIGAKIANDKPHASMEKFDVHEFIEGAIREALESPEEDDPPFEHEICDFSGTSANWVVVRLPHSAAVYLKMMLIELAKNRGLTVYDPQDKSLTDHPWVSDAVETSQWKMKLECESQKCIYDPTPSQIRRKLRKLLLSYAVLTDSRGNFVQVGGGGTICVLERWIADEGKLYRAFQDRPSYKTPAGTELRFGNSVAIMNTDNWFSMDTVTDSFIAFAGGKPLPPAVKWRPEISNCDSPPTFNGKLHVSAGPKKPSRDQQGFWASVYHLFRRVVG
jgi:hypothetical protein